MGTQIISRPISADGDIRLQIDNSCAARKLIISPGSWNELWIGGRWSMEDTGATLPTTSLLYIGLMVDPVTGITNGPLNNICTHFAGIRNITNAWTRNTSPIIYYAASGMRGSTKVVATETLNANPNLAPFIPATSTDIRTAFVITLLKGSPNWSINMSSVTGTNGLVDISASAVKTAMLAQTTINDLTTALNTAIGGSGTRYTNSLTAGNPAVSEGTNGNLTSIVLGWNRDTYIEFSDIFWVKKS